MSSTATVAQVHVDSSCEHVRDVTSEDRTTSRAPMLPMLSDDAILSIARRAGMLVMLDGRIGRETYQSVTGSLSSLQRFVADLRGLMLDEATH